MPLQPDNPKDNEILDQLKAAAEEGLDLPDPIKEAVGAGGSIASPTAQGVDVEFDSDEGDSGSGGVDGADTDGVVELLTLILSEIKDIPKNIAEELKNL